MKAPNISADDAARLDLRNGERVRVPSRYGEVLHQFESSGWPGWDSIVHTPEYKAVAARVECGKNLARFHWVREINRVS